MSLRFLHLHSTFAAGGKELRCVRLINALGPAIEHSIVSGEPQETGAADHLDEGARAHFALDFPPLRGRPTPRRLLALARAMRGHDLVLSYNWGAIDAVMAHRLFARVLRLPPLIHHEDGFNEDERAALKTRRNLYRRLALASASALVVPSQQLRRIALGDWHQPPERVACIPNGIDTSRFAERPAPDAVPGIAKRDGELWVGTLAGLRPVKNLPRLVRAFAALPSSWRLVIVGEGPEREAILAEAMRSGVADRVVLPGFIADPARYAGLFDIFALSSDSEQFPISVVEAMAAGLPVAAPQVGDVAAMVAAENAPFVTAPGDEAALAQSLVQLAGDEALREAVGRANRQLARERYDESAMIAAHRQLYERALGTRLPG